MRCNYYSREITMLFELFLICFISTLQYDDVAGVQKYENSTSLGCNKCKCNGTFVDCANVKLDYLPGDFPSNITGLSLAKCGLTALNDTELGTLYKHLRHLDIRDNKIAELKNATFAGLNELEYLDMGGNKYRADKIDPFVFSSLPNILEIIVRGYGNYDQNKDLERNVSKAWFDTFKGLENSTIERITFDAITVNPIILEKDIFIPLSNTKLKYLRLYNIRLVEIDMNSLLYLPFLEEIDISMNSLQMDLRYLDTYRNLYNSKLRHVIFHDNVQNYKPQKHYELLPEFIAKFFTINFPKTIEEINFSKSTMTRGVGCYMSYGFKLERDNAIKKFDISNFKLMQRLGPMLGLVHLKEFYLQGIGSELFPSTVTCDNGAFESI
ncbi:unnamed protein product, partial [Owenia fusiformis]